MGEHWSAANLYGHMYPYFIVVLSLKHNVGACRYIIYGHFMTETDSICHEYKLRMKKPRPLYLIYKVFCMFGVVFVFTKRAFGCLLCDFWQWGMAVISNIHSSDWICMNSKYGISSTCVICCIISYQLDTNQFKLWIYPRSATFYEPDYVTMQHNGKWLKRGCGN